MSIYLKGHNTLTGNDKYPKDLAVYFGPLPSTITTYADAVAYVQASTSLLTSPRLVSELAGTTTIIDPWVAPVLTGLKRVVNGSSLTVYGRSAGTPLPTLEVSLAGVNSWDTVWHDLAPDTYTDLNGSYNNSYTYTNLGAGTGTVSLRVKNTPNTALSVAVTIDAVTAPTGALSFGTLIYTASTKKLVVPVMGAVGMITYTIVGVNVFTSQPSDGFLLTDNAVGTNVTVRAKTDTQASIETTIMAVQGSTTTPTTPAAPSTGTLLATPGRTPVRDRQRVRVYTVSGSKKVDVEMTPATGWQYKWANTTGAYANQAFTDWASLSWTDVPTTGIVTVNAPANDNDNTTVVRIGNKNDVNEYYDTPIRTIDTYDWNEFGGAISQIAPLAGPRILDQTDTKRLHLVWDRFDGSDSIWKDISGFTRSANSWFWVVGGSHTKIANNAAMGELRLAQGVITMVYRNEVLPGYNRETGLLQNQNDGTTAVVNTDAVILYTGKP